MSMLPRCTCGRMGSGFGQFSEYCARHGSSARWMKQRQQQRAADLIALRAQALSRPVHGGYPGSVPAHPSMGALQLVTDNEKS